MKTLARQIAALAGLLLLICAIHRISTGNAYTVTVPSGDTRAEAVYFTPDDMGRIALDAPEYRDGSTRVRVLPRQPGAASFQVYDGQDRPLNRREFRVDRLMTVYDVSTGGFTDDTWVFAAITVFFLAVAGLMARWYLRARGPDFYAYTTIYAAGFSLFMLLTGAMMGYVTLRHVLRPSEYTMLSAYLTISRAAYVFMLTTLPFIGAFAVAMAVSNIALLRHERTKLKNVLGLLASALLIAGVIAAQLLYRKDVPVSGVRGDLTETFRSVFATIYVYFECMLIGTIICGFRAATHVPPPDRDFIIILGCLFRKDGTLTPLLQGRVDRALAFWREQARLTGREAALIPSGGQGDGETMAEARAMRDYMLAQGVPDRLILPEERSRNTRENMEYSKAIIDARQPGAKTAFVTTNYHVFRSGVWAAMAGLNAEGLGSRTRWWYWPNAFMRECLGLAVRRVKQELLLLGILIMFFYTLSVLLG